MPKHKIRIAQYSSAESNDEAYRAAAERLPWIRDGECEVDSEAVVSSSDEGAYVMAWVWVYREDAHPCDHTFELDDEMINVCTKCSADEGE